MIHKYYVIESWDDQFNELRFIDNDGYWTSFLTDAKVFNSKEEAQEYYYKRNMLGAEITCRFY